MNRQEVLDFCNAKTKAIDDDDDGGTNCMEDMIPLKSLQGMSEDVEKQVFGTENVDAAGLLELNDEHLGGCLEGEEDQRANKVNGNEKKGVSDESPLANSDLDNCSKDHQCQGPNCDSGSVEPNFSYGDMDMGVDLTLNESGVLESEPLTQNVEQGIPDILVLTAESTALHTDSAEPERALKVENSLPLESVKGKASSAISVSEENERHKHGGKRVTFPSDEDIVSGAVEPKDPWRHAQNVTVEEILSAYRQACQKLNCKPIPKVLKQIQESVGHDWW
ncbi:hypothetical protein Z043-108698 [Arapaima gigas]